MNGGPKWSKTAKAKSMTLEQHTAAHSSFGETATDARGGTEADTKSIYVKDGLGGRPAIRFPYEPLEPKKWSASNSGDFEVRRIGETWYQVSHAKVDLAMSSQSRLNPAELDELRARLTALRSVQL